MGLEPTTSSLGSWHSTTELLPLNRRGHCDQIGPGRPHHITRRAANSSPFLMAGNSTATPHPPLPKPACSGTRIDRSPAYPSHPTHRPARTEVLSASIQKTRGRCPPH